MYLILSLTICFLHWKISLGVNAPVRNHSLIHSCNFEIVGQELGQGIGQGLEQGL